MWIIELGTFIRIEIDNVQNKCKLEMKSIFNSIFESKLEIFLQLLLKYNKSSVKLQNEFVFFNFHSSQSSSSSAISEYSNMKMSKGK